MNYILKNGEEAMLKLRGLYESRGYAHFKMSKFEEYDLYAENKEFLKSGNILTFNDPSGRLMALKPDVTMSIIKNSTVENDGTEKVYYNENVYRATDGIAFKEIMQTGLECIGKIDLYSICEVISLAAKSLEMFSEDYVIDISHMGILSELIKNTDAREEAKREIIDCISKKSLHGLKAICDSENIDKAHTDKLTALLTLDADTQNGLSRLKEICGYTSSVKELESILDVLNKTIGNSHIRLDFSVVQGMHYYNGIVFQGFIDGIPEKILSGGQYDKLVKRMGKNAGAIGFGISTELLAKLEANTKKSSTDILIIYDDNADVSDLQLEVAKLIEGGKRVEVSRNIPSKKRYESIVKFENGRLIDVR